MSDSLKRPHGSSRTEDALSLVAVDPKRARNEIATLSDPDRTKSLIQSGPLRCSDLESPIMLLTGHEGEIFTCKFHPEGKTLASAGLDRSIFFWNVYGDCENYRVINAAHKSAILDLAYDPDSGQYLYTCSVDKSVAQYDTATGARIKKFKSHAGIVNAICPARGGRNLVSSVGDDAQLKVWDTRIRRQVKSFSDDYALTAVAFSDDGNQVFAGGIENTIKVYDLRKNDLFARWPGHFDTITGLSLSPDGSYLLSNSMDNSLCVWDVRPFTLNENRCVKTLQGHSHNFEKNLLRSAWSADGSMISAGSADRFVYVWDFASRRILYKLPGHKGSVNEVVFHPHESIILSGSSDKQLYLGEIDTNF